LTINLPSLPILQTILAFALTSLPDLLLRKDPDHLFPRFSRTLQNRSCARPADLSPPAGEFSTGDAQKLCDISLQEGARGAERDRLDDRRHWA
jgi:hypothetical protein